MEKIILGFGTIGHVNYGRTTLASAIEKVTSERGINDKEPETVFTIKPIEVPESIFTHPMTRKERRAKERKNKK